MKIIANELVNIAKCLVADGMNGNIRYKISMALKKYCYDAARYDLGAPIVNVLVGDVEISSSPANYEKAYGDHGPLLQTHSESTDLDDYVEKYIGYDEGKLCRYDWFFKEYMDMDWNTMSKSDKNLCQTVLMKTFGNGKWMDAVVNVYNDDDELVLDGAGGKALIALKIQKDGFMLHVKDGKLDKDCLDSVLDKMVADEIESRENDFDIPDEDDDYDDDRADYAYDPYGGR